MRFKLFIITLASAGLMLAQTPATHSVTLTWSDVSNPTGTTYNIYRATGLCSGSPLFAKIATAVVAMTYMDTTVTPGNYCYQATATANGVESAPSNTAGAPVPSFAPQSFAVTVK